MLDGKTAEDVINGSAEAQGDGPKTDGKGNGKGEKKQKKKGAKVVKGDHRIIVECGTAEQVVFQREKDPEKVYGRRKNRKARFVVEKPEDWRSVDMVDSPQRSAPLDGADSSSEENASDSEAEYDGGVVLESADSRPDDHALGDTVEYGYGGGKVRPPQQVNDVNGSVGGEKGWAERIEETDDMKAKRREGQRRANEREMVRKAARRACAFGLTIEGEAEKRKCEAVMKGAVVEASFAKGEWGIRWREKI